MLRTIRWYSKFFIMLILTSPKLIYASMLKKQKSTKDFDDFCHRVTSKWSLNRIKDSGAEINILNKENIPTDRNVLFVSNHQSNFDIAILMSLVPGYKGFVAKVELNNFPILNLWMKNINCIFIDRNDMRSALHTIIKGIEILKKGYSMVVFPEGTRSQCDKMGEFKVGSFKLATKSKVPIVPITIDGSYRIMEGNNYKVKPANVNVYIHKPIFLENLLDCELGELPIIVKDIIGSKLPQ